MNGMNRMKRRPISKGVNGVMKGDSRRMAEEVA
jgi:hypothetical protein